MDQPTAVRLQPAYDDPDSIRALIETAGPFWPLTNYAASADEMRALGSPGPQFTPPWFRQDFARGGEVSFAGAEAILHNEHFIAAARSIYGTDVLVRPSDVYVNIMGPTPFPFPPHLDVPAFAGFTRADYPLWLLKTMKTSGLFEEWRILIATAVSWFFAGPGGDFWYWPDGTDAPAAVEKAPFDNVAVVADNEATFHGVGACGEDGAHLPGDLTPEHRLVRGDRGWDVLHDDTFVLHYDDEDVRITVSWKADVFRGADHSEVDAGRLELDVVVERFLADLSERGVAASRPDDPLHDREWIAVLGSTYRDVAPAIAG